jgi:hypothetical protein
MLTKPLLAVSLLASLVAVSGAADAAATKRHWSSGSGATAYRNVGPNGEVRESFVPTGNDIAPSRGDSQNAWRYHGGPKSAF